MHLTYLVYISIEVERTPVKLLMFTNRIRCRVRCRCGPFPDVPRKQLNALSDATHRERQSASQSWRGDCGWDLRKSFGLP